MNFTAEHKTHMPMGGDFQYFDYGVHKVKLVAFTKETSPEGKVYIEVFFESLDGDRQESKRQYFTTDKGITFAFNLFKSIFLAAAPEKFKAAAEKSFMALKNVDEMVALLNEKLAGKEAWISKYPSTTRTMANGKPAPEVMLSATEPRSRLVEAAEDVFGVKAEVSEDPINSWDK